jgi:hypothetical protein
MTESPAIAERNVALQQNGDKAAGQDDAAVYAT